MPRKYEKEKSQRVKEKKAIEDSKPKLPITNDVICVSCKKPSGWDNDALRYVSGNRELKCRNCGEVCVQVIGKPKISEEHKADNRTVEINKTN